MDRMGNFDIETPQTEVGCSSSSTHMAMEDEARRFGSSGFSTFRSEGGPIL